jgi:hypothetical protein
MAKFCPNCGTGLAEAAKFCPACGAQIPGAPQQQPYIQPQPPVSPPPLTKKKSKALFIALGAAALLVVLVAIIAISANRGGPDPAERDRTTVSASGPTGGGTATQPPAALPPIEHTETRRIHASLPTFEFALHGYADVDGSDPGDTLEIARIYAIEIQGDGFHQRLDGFETEIVIPDGGFPEGEEYGLEFADFNNDGFLDLRLYVITTMRKGLSLFWLWDSGRNGYVRNEQLEELSDARHFDKEGDGDRLYRFIKSPGEAGTTHNNYYYEYIGDAFVLVEYELLWYEYSGGESYENIENYQLIDGEMKLTSKTREME